MDFKCSRVSLLPLLKIVAYVMRTFKEKRYTHAAPLGLFFQAVLIFYTDVAPTGLKTPECTQSPKSAQSASSV